MGPIDIGVFVLFVLSVITIGLLKSRKESTSEDYFLAGRGLTWWLVGFSLIAANISTEQFVGMSGKAADWLGMAIASYEWMAAITLVVVAFLFLPKFLKSGIYTIPEFLEYRYNALARWVMATATLIILVGVPTASVIYSGAKVICVFFAGKTMFGLDLGNITVGCWIIGILATAYVFAGGLKACAWADLIQGAALIIGGAIIAYFAITYLGSADPADLTPAVSNVNVEDLREAGALERFRILNDAPQPDGKLNMFRNAEDPEIPWTALMLGLWIPNFFYWGLNQYITQRTLGSKSLSEGQKGVVFAALLKLIIPFVVVVPGILALNLFSDDLKELATQNNAEVMQIYTENKDNPDNAKVAFEMNDEFIEAYPNLAKDLVKFNARVANSELNNSEDILAANNEILGKIKEYNTLPETVTAKGRIDIQTKLVARDYDAAFPVLLSNLLPVGRGILGFVLAAIFGAVVSSLASMLNSASTIATMDIYKKLRKGDPSQTELITAGRAFVVLFVLIALTIAPKLGSPVFGGIFTFIQEFQGFISPGILSVFIFGILIKRAPRIVGTIGILLNIVLYGLFKFSPAIPGLKLCPFFQNIAGWSFLNRMALCLVTILIVLTIVTIIKPLRDPIVMPVNEKMDMTTSLGTKIFGLVVIALTIALYVIFF